MVQNLSHNDIDSNSSGKDSSSTNSIFKSNASASIKTSKLDAKVESSGGKKGKTQPILVNSGEETMHLPMSSHSFLKSHKAKEPVLQSPAPSSFSISSILSSLQNDDSTQADIDVIAEIYGRSKLSLANEYSSHRIPIGAGLDLEDEEDEEDRAIPALALDTNAAVHHLETVEELPSPMSAGPGKGLGSKNMCTTEPDSDDIAASRMSVWQAKAQQGSATARSVASVSRHIEGRGRSGSLAQQPSELRDNIGDSRAVKQLLKVSGKT